MDFEDGITELYALRRRGLAGDADAYAVARDRLAVLLPPAAGRDRARLLQVLGQVERDQGERTAALDAYEKAVAIWRALGEADGLAHALRHAADIRREAGDAALALAEIDEALGLLGGADGLTRGNGLRVRALCLEALGRPAREAWLEVKALYEQVGVAAGIEECERHLG